MTILEAIQARHTVRQYLDRPLSEDIVRVISERLASHNAQYQLKMRLVTENEAAFGAVLKLFLAKGVRNYIVLAGQKGSDTEERLGYCGIDAALLAQSLGLNSWWVGGTFNKKKVAQAVPLAENEVITGILVIGYGKEQGKPHESKKAAEVSRYNGPAPQWFTKGVESALLAPTALNKQAFFLEGDGDRVALTCDNGVFTNTDRGIVKYHFEQGAGTANFHWA